MLYNIVSVSAIYQHEGQLFKAYFFTNSVFLLENLTAWSYTVCSDTIYKVSLVFLSFLKNSLYYCYFLLKKIGYAGSLLQCSGILYILRHVEASL